MPLSPSFLMTLSSFSTPHSPSALMLSRPCSAFFCWPGQYFKTQYSSLSLKWLNVISLQYDTYRLIILAATILRTTLGILIVSPEDNSSVRVPWATSWTKWGLDMNPMKRSILDKVTLTRYLGIAGKGCPLPHEIKCFLAWNSWYFVISGSKSWTFRCGNISTIVDKICILVTLASDWRYAAASASIEWSVSICSLPFFQH